MMSATNMFLLSNMKITFGSAHEILVFIHIYASACADPEWGDRGSALLPPENSVFVVS